MERPPKLENTSNKVPKGENILKKIVKVGLIAGVMGTASHSQDSFAQNKTDKKNPKQTTIVLDNPETNKGQEFIDNEIAECRKIINNKDYEKIIHNPYLVSALYYSTQAINKIALSSMNGPQKILHGICPFITQDFRENYIKTLKKMTETKSNGHQVSNQESAPLDIVNFSKNLNENHQDAIDLFTEEGSPIYSISGGIVVLAENGWTKENELSTSSNKGGNTVIVFDPYNESFYRYEHMQKVEVKPGVIINNSTKIGFVGHTGINASKPGHGGHLHLEINKYNKQNNTMGATDVFELKKMLVKIENKKYLAKF